MCVNRVTAVLVNIAVPSSEHWPHIHCKIFFLCGEMSSAAGWFCCHSGGVQKKKKEPLEDISDKTQNIVDGIESHFPSFEEANGLTMCRSEGNFPHNASQHANRADNATRAKLSDGEKGSAGFRNLGQ